MWSFALALTGTARAQDPHAGHASEQAAAQAPATAERNPKLPAGEDQAKAALNTSPRHGEYVDVPVPAACRSARGSSTPSARTRRPSSSSSTRSSACRTGSAASPTSSPREGFIAVAPDLISGQRPQRRRHRLGRDARRRREARARADACGSRRAAERRPRLGAGASGRERQERHRRDSAGAAARASGYATSQPALERGGRLLRHLARRVRARRGARRRCSGSTAATTRGSRPRWRRPTRR